MIGIYIFWALFTTFMIIFALYVKNKRHKPHQEK